MVFKGGESEGKGGSKNNNPTTTKTTGTQTWQYGAEQVGCYP